MIVSLYRVQIEASPDALWETLMDTGRVCAFTGASAQISREKGGKFSMFGGSVEGEQIDFVCFHFLLTHAHSIIHNIYFFIFYCLLDERKENRTKVAFQDVANWTLFESCHELQSTR